MLPTVRTEQPIGTWKGVIDTYLPGADFGPAAANSQLRRGRAIRELSARQTLQENGGEILAAIMSGRPAVRRNIVSTRFSKTEAKFSTID